MGVLETGDALWSGVVGKHGISERNQAGEEFLQLCATNQLTVMNTWYQKKAIHYGTWMHPATKKHHLIDFVVMRADQRRCCRDVQVMRGANCWTDHRMVRAKLCLGVMRFGRKQSRPLPLAVHKLDSQQVRDEYRELLESVLQNSLEGHEETIEEKWRRMSMCIMSAAEEVVGRGGRKHPEWFDACADVLSPLIKAKNVAYSRYIRSNSQAHKSEFRKCQRMKI